MAPGNTLYTIRRGGEELGATEHSPSDTCPRGNPTRTMELASGPFPAAPRLRSKKKRRDLLLRPTRTHGAWSLCRSNPTAAMVGRGRRERGWRAGRRSPQIRARSHEELAWKGGKAKRKGRRREGGTIRLPPWLRAWRARIRPPPELAASICASPAAPARRCARGGRAGEGRRRRRARIRPALELAASIRASPAAPARRHTRGR